MMRKPARRKITDSFSVIYFDANAIPLDVRLVDGNYEVFRRSTHLMPVDVDEDARATTFNDRIAALAAEELRDGDVLLFANDIPACKLDKGDGIVDMRMLSVPIILAVRRKVMEGVPKENPSTSPGQSPSCTTAAAGESVLTGLTPETKCSDASTTGRLRRASAIAAAECVNAVLKHFEGPDPGDAPHPPAIASLLSPASIGSTTSGVKRRRTADSQPLQLDMSNRKRGRSNSKKPATKSRNDDFVDLLTDSDTEVVQVTPPQPEITNVDMMCPSPKFTSPLHVHDCVNIPPYGWGHVDTISKSSLDGSPHQYTVKLWCGAVLHTFEHYLQATNSHRVANEDKVGRYAGVAYVASDVYRLSEGVYLNDTLVDIGIARHAAALQTQVQRSIRCAGTFAMALMARDLSALLDDAKKQQALTAASASTRLFGNEMDPFQRLFTCFPFNDNNHWSIAVICYPAMLFSQHTPKTQTVTTYGELHMYGELPPVLVDEEPVGSTRFCKVRGSPSENAQNTQQPSKLHRSLVSKNSVPRHEAGRRKANTCALDLLAQQLTMLLHQLEPLPSSILGSGALCNIQEILHTVGVCCAGASETLQPSSKWEAMHAADLVMTAQSGLVTPIPSVGTSAQVTFRHMRDQAAALDTMAAAAAQELQRIKAEHRRIIESKAAELSIPADEDEDVILMDNKMKREAAYHRTLRLAALHGKRRAGVLLTSEAKKQVASMRATEIHRIDVKLQAAELRLSAESSRAASAKQSAVIIRHKLAHVRQERTALETELKLRYFRYAALGDSLGTTESTECACLHSVEAELRLLHFMTELHSIVLERLAEVLSLVVMTMEEAADTMQPLRQEKSALQQDMKVALKHQAGLQKYFAEIELRSIEPPVPCILFLDSLKFHRVQNVTRTLRQYLEYMSRLHYSDGTAAEAPVVVDATSMVAVQPEEMPRQDNDCDCGMFIIEYFKHFTTPILPHVTSKDVSDKLRQVIPDDWFDNTTINASREEMMSWMVNGVPLQQHSQSGTINKSLSERST